LRFERRLDTPRWLFVAVPVGSSIGALLVGAVVLLATGHNPMSTYFRLFERGFFSQSALSSTLRSATPLLFTGLAAAVAFRMRLWNIGAEGQLYMGAVGASGIGLALRGSSASVIIPAMIVAGIALGALWALVPGVLRAFFNTNEIITSLMLNYVARLVLTYLILDSMSPWRDQSPGATFPLGARLPPEASWPQFTTGLNFLAVALLASVIAFRVGAWARRPASDHSSRRPVVIVFTVGAVLVIVWGARALGPTIVVPFGMVLGLISAVLIWVLYWEMRFGFQVRVISDSVAAARYGGMSPKRKIVAVMLLSGGLAGLGGASQVGDFAHLLDPYGLPQSSYGYTGIVVAALACNNPFGAVLAAFLLGGLTNAGFSLRGLDFPLGLVGVLQGLILFFAIGGEVLVRYRLRLSQWRVHGDRGPLGDDPPDQGRSTGTEVTTGRQQ
jgi:ABC-type uncharacterized transport system permease subunit